MDSWKEAIDYNPDIAVISNPSSSHVESAKRISDHVRGIFIENIASMAP